MSNYDNFSIYYDAFTTDVDYKTRTKMIIDLFEKYDKKPSLLLDLACGTGGFSFEFAKSGTDVIGVDPSVGMLSVAMEKLPKDSQNPLFLNQSAEDLELFGTVDGAICMLDSLNHITDIKNLEKSFERVSLFLEKDRLFIFDLNSPYKHKEILSNNTFVKENENVFCVWQNQTEDGKKIDIFIDLFVELENGNYERLTEDFSEISYSAEEIKEILSKTGFEALDILDADSGEGINETSQRILYIVRKK